MQVELHDKNSSDYQKICDVAAAVYKQRLGMQYHGFPAKMVVAYNRSQEILGSIGITRGDEVPALSITECIGEIPVAPHKAAEVSRLNVADRQCTLLAAQLVATMFIYAWKTGIDEVFVTVHAGARRLLRQMHIPLRVLGEVDISAYKVEGGELYRKLRPQALQINLGEARQACQASLPPPDWFGPKLSQLLTPSCHPVAARAVV